MNQVVEFDGKLYELNMAAFMMPLTILRDPYKAPDFLQYHLTRTVSMPLAPSQHAIISIEDTDRMERLETMDSIYAKSFRIMHRKLLGHHLPKRLRK